MARAPSSGGGGEGAGRFLVFFQMRFPRILTRGCTDFPLVSCVSSELAREKMWSRIHLIPMLQAEEDRDLVRRTWADKARERALLGKETSVYHSDRWV